MIKAKLNWMFIKMLFFLTTVILVTPLALLVFASLMSSESLFNGIPSISYAIENQLNFNQLNARIDEIFDDRLLFSSLVQSLLTSILCGLTVAAMSWTAGYGFSRSSHFLVKISMPIALCTYLLPPVTLVIALSNTFSNFNIIPTELVIFIGHCLYLFPLGFVLSIGFWYQKPNEIDQLAIADGGTVFDSFRLNHGKKEISYFFVIGLLVFMVSWGDVIFSRVLASNNNGDRLLVDLIFQKIFANAEIEAYGEVALFSLFVIFISFALSLIFSYLLIKSTNSEA